MNAIKEAAAPHHEAASITSPEGAEQKLTNLIDWLMQGGASFHKLRIVHQENGERGVVAMEDIAPEEVLFKIPFSYVLTESLARASDIGRHIQQHVSPEVDVPYQAIFLLAERRRTDSFWKLFLDSLPKAFPHIPLCFNEQERHLLKGTTALGVLKAQDQLNQQSYEQLCKQVPGFAQFTLEEFTWARLVLSSRTFRARVNGRLDRCLVPLADMLNHRMVPDAIWSTSEDDQYFVVSARHAVSAGSEICINYGMRSTDQFLTVYGFIPEDETHASHDEVRLILSLSETDPLVASKQKLLGREPNVYWESFNVQHRYEARAMQEMLTFLRVAHAAPEEMPEVEAAIGEGGRVGPLSLATEERVLRALAAVCESRLAEFETSAEEDERLLREEPLSSNARSCVRLRLQEKRLLLGFVELASTVRALLHKPLAELEQLAGQADIYWGWFDGYIRDVALEASYRSRLGAAALKMRGLL